MVSHGFDHRDGRVNHIKDWVKHEEDALHFGIWLVSAREVVVESFADHAVLGEKVLDDCVRVDAEIASENGDCVIDACKDHENGCERDHGS